MKIVEGEKSVKQEIEVEGDNKEEVVSETLDLYSKVKPLCSRETLIKAGVR